MRSLGIDYGSKRVGIALSDEGGIMAFPHSVIQNSSEFLKEIVQLCEENKVKQIVIGESKDLKGIRNRIMDDIDVFIHDWKDKSDIPIYLEPEFLTSHQARKIQGINEMLDASAATIILQSYLDKIKNK